MSMAAAPYCPPEWLALREGADAAARATALVAPLRAYLGDVGRAVIRDLGCGTGSMARWLAPLLPGPQHWIMHDRDPVLLAHAAASVVDGRAVTVATERRDITGLRGDDLAGTSLVTASALLDLLTAVEVDRLAAACAGIPALLTLSVAGEVELTPADPLDAEIHAAFNAHQRRVTGGRRLLGPDAPAVAAEAFERHGAVVREQASPWRLGADRSALTREWLSGWVDAACAERPDLAVPAEDYRRRRLEACAGGELRVVVQHRDLLALPAA
ncbi:hypothetical protein GCM10027176_25750 [Actinoallomurus bryophytorum]|uniref:Methyltransferase family protein n=1 Tax=Actinoallomurus bryophytorum TaxID=1490222 RepID=A0A543CPI9_9ACTN|nr:class I SAM-dependent methyltransferase [Actinoallomurus bryophytorum]TQL99012.1 hypothetical protein FB559_4665 [Actinoallomurus bryophytorum]